jgi:hypothetical protein
MTIIRKAARLLGFMILAIALMLSPPTSVHEEYMTSESLPETAGSNQGNKPKFATRKHSTLLYKLIVVSRNLPILFVVLQIILKRMPFPPLSFKPYILILLKRLFMDPIKFTSIFVSVKNPSVA